MKTQRLQLAALLACCLWLLIQAAQAHADRDIVYSARYYTPPGIRGTSHWHLYRINADGTGRRQITFGNLDDTMPRWSPDGGHIAFVRTQNDEEGQVPRIVCVTDVGGHHTLPLLTIAKDDWLHKIAWSSDHRTLALYLDHRGNGSDKPQVILFDIQNRHQRTLEGREAPAWSPSGRRLCCFVRSEANISEVLDLDTGKTTRLRNEVDYAFWLTADSLLGLRMVVKQNGTEAYPAYFLSTTTADHEKKRIPLVAEPAFLSGLAIRELLSVPHNRRAVILGVDHSNSTVRPQNRYYQIDTSNGKVTELVHGQFLCFAPDGKRFLTAPGRDLGPYGMNKEGKLRKVWISNLQIGSMPDGKLKVITPGTVWVLGADWRRGP